MTIVILSPYDFVTRKWEYYDHCLLRRQIFSTFQTFFISNYFLRQSDVECGFELRIQMCDSFQSLHWIRCSHLISEYLCVWRFSECDNFRIALAAVAISIRSLSMCHRIWMRDPFIAQPIFAVANSLAEHYCLLFFFRYVNFVTFVSCHNWHSTASILFCFGINQRLWTL